MYLIFFSCNIFFSFISKNVMSLLDSKSWTFTLMFSSINFIVLAPMFRFLIPFEFFFFFLIECVRETSSLFCMRISYCHRTICWKDCELPPNGLQPILPSTEHKHEGFYFWFFNSVPCTCISVHMLVPYSLNYCSFVVSFEKWEV